MSLCVNPHCQKPQNPDNLLFCEYCGSELLIQGRYRVVRQLGKGGFGKTYEVSEARSNIPKVLKVLVNNDSKAIELFQQEANVLKLLDHPGIPKVESDGYFVYFPRNWTVPLHCLVMEKIEGLDLQEYLTQRDNQPIDQKLALQWLTDVVNILQQVHQHNFFHRDLKPSNIMLRADGRLALIDFGTARAITGTYMAKQPAAQVTGINSPGYTPLEQINFQAVPQSDFFALGRTFVFLLTGKQPSDPGIYDPHNDQLNWRNFAPQVAPQLADFIDQMMERLANKRPVNTQVILQSLADIERLLYPPRTTQPPRNSPQQVQPLVTPSSGLTRRRFAKWLGFGGIGLGGATLIYILFPNKKSTLTVSPSGSGDYITISEAIRNADPGTRILVQPGHYQESIIINKPLKIIGDGSKADILVESTGSNCLLMQANYAEVTGLTLRCRAGLNNQGYFAVDIQQGELSLTDCDITCDSLSCVAIHGSTANPVIKNCQIHDSKENGIFVFDNGQGRVEDCDISGNGLSGVEIKNNGNPIIRGCKVHDNKSGGIFVHGNGQATVEDCDISANTLAGVTIEDSSNPIIRGCKIRNGASDGVLVSKNGQGTVENCDVSGNAYSGIEIRENGNPVVRQCKISQNQYYAVYAHDKASGTIENCVVTGNLRSTFYIDTTSQLQRNGNTE
jgi:parallel beta-helix repeat protein